MKSLLALLVAIPLFLRAEENPAIKPVDRNGEDWWAKRHEARLAEAQKGEAQLVFLGDSITQGWEGAKKIWDKSFGAWKPLNLGFSGDRTEHVLWRIDHGEFDGIKPKLIVIMIGTNNIGHGSSTPAQTADGMRDILARLAKKTPGAKILLLGVFPRGEKADDPLRVKAAEINKLYAPMADGSRVHWLDIGEKFIQPGNVLTKDLMPDFLHLSGKGYQIWADAIEAKVAELMK